MICLLTIDNYTVTFFRDEWSGAATPLEFGTVQMVRLTPFWEGYYVLISNIIRIR